MNFIDKIKIFIKNIFKKENKMIEAPKTEIPKSIKSPSELFSEKLKKQSYIKKKIIVRKCDGDGFGINKPFEKYYK